MSQNVGDIIFDKSLDDIDFELCDTRIYQYYSVGTSYVGGRKSIRNFLYKEISSPYFDSSFSGFLTIRFVVSCNGKTGRFRAKMVNIYLKEIEFRKDKIEFLINCLKSLNDWNVGSSKGVALNSYYQINFKINKGLILDIY